MEQAVPTNSWFTFSRGRQFLWKTILLGATTLALVPILLYKDVLWAQTYLVTLILVHIGGGVLIVVGNRRHHIAPDRRGLIIRLVGIASMVILLYIAAKGLGTTVGSWVFWGSLFAIWALHTLGLLMLHVRSRREATVCPFV
jgi:hypothetical protein